MTTTTDTQTTEERRLQAARSVEQIEGELVRIHTRQQEAGATLEQLQADILTHERDGSAHALQALPGLRQERAAQQEIREDLAQLLPAIERDLEVARAYLQVATIACHAERYNGIVKQQRSLIQAISEALDTITKAVQVKEELARKQDLIQTSDVGRPYGELSPTGIRHAILTEIMKRFHKQETPTPLLALDWSSRRMRLDGELE